MPNKFFGQNLQVENEKSEEYYWILHIQISLGKNFNILDWDGYFRSQTEKVNITNEFCIFELV